MTTRVPFKSRNGSEISGELAEPAGRSPALVLIQEYWGVNAHIKDVAERLAREGFVVVAPDLYHGKVTKDPNEASKLMTALDTRGAVDDIAGAAAYLKDHPRSNGKVGVIGFCMGGALSLASACDVQGLGAVAAFYGIPPAEKVDYASVTAPIQAHFCDGDEWASVAKAEDVKKQLEQRGQSMELFTYDAPHAFMNDTRPEVHDPEKAKLAWDRAMTFLKKHLA